MEKITSMLPNWVFTLPQIDTLSTKAKHLGVHKDNILVLTAVSALVIYLGTVRYLRYKNLDYIRTKYPNPQEVLDSLEIAQEINAITMKKEFPFLGREGLEFALFKTYTVPTISKLLNATGEFAKNCPRRVEDTELILQEIIDPYARIVNQLQKNPKTSRDDVDKQWERSELAQKRLNELHGKYNINNGDMLYTLSLFMFEPVVWVNKYEWRPMDEREINASFCLWYHVGLNMNIKDIPNTPAKMMEFKNKYASDHIEYAPTNWKCGEPTVRHLLSNLPSFLREPAYKIMLRVLPSMLDADDAAAFNLPYKESKAITKLINTVFYIRALVTRHCMLPRSAFLNRTPFYSNKEGKYIPEYYSYKPHIYKNGYSINELGPAKFHPHQDKKTKSDGHACPMMHDL